MHVYDSGLDNFDLFLQLDKRLSEVGIVKQVQALQ